MQEDRNRLRGADRRRVKTRQQKLPPSVARTHWPSNPPAEDDGRPTTANRAQPASVAPASRAPARSLWPTTASFFATTSQSDREVLEGLREPLERATPAIVRATRHTALLAMFQIFAPIHRDPCGFRGDRQRLCQCGAERGRVTGPASRASGSTASISSSRRRPCGRTFLPATILSRNRRTRPQAERDSRPAAAMAAPGPHAGPIPQPRASTAP